MSSRAHHWVLQRGAWPSMSSRMLKILERLRVAKQNEWPFIAITDVDPRTLRALFERDWIFESKGVNGLRYCITERGERAYKAYTTPVRRNDKLCPACGTRARHTTASGRLSAYCLECDNESKRKAYKLKRPAKNPNTPCSRCHKRPRHVYKSGRVCTYCLHCKNVRGRRRKKQDRKRDVQLAQDGVVKLCSRPGCTRPRHVAPSGVLDWCREHYREWHNEYRRKKKIGQPPKRIGRPPKQRIEESLQ